MTEATKERWKNVVQYIAAMNDKQEYSTIKDQEAISEEMYKWLNKTYKLTKKK